MMVVVVSARVSALYLTKPAREGLNIRTLAFRQSFRVIARSATDKKVRRALTWPGRAHRGALARVLEIEEDTVALITVNHSVYRLAH